MPKKEADKTAGAVEVPQTTYRAALMVGTQQLATITLRANDDADAKAQLDNAKPTYFEGVGEWTLSKTETVQVPLGA